jgi:Penicillin-insensitive murein endopeptidase
MGWRLNEVWLDTDVLWFREQPRRPFAGLAPPAPAFAGDGLEPAPFMPIETGLAASRQRRLAAQAARRRRLATRTVPAVALVLGSATMLPMWAFRQGGGGQDAGRLLEDPPSLTFRLNGARFEVSEAPVLAPRTPFRKPKPRPPARTLARTTEFARVEWRRASSFGLPYSGRLVDGTQLPVEGPDWVTWNPITDSRPNQPNRLYGNERTIRTILSVITAYRTAHAGAPRVVVGDISLRDGGWMDGHVSHQNGLDVDVYYPRLDRYLSAPIDPSQIDRDLAQDLLDRFVAAGAQIIFVGYSTGLRGPSGVVVPYPNHENHMHVRFPPPPG